MNQIIIIDGDAGSAQASPPVDIGDLDRYSVHTKFSASASGVLRVQASNYREGPFVDVANGSVELVDCDWMFNVANAGYRYFKMTWTPTAGSGTIESKAVLKEQYVKGA